MRGTGRAATAAALAAAVATGLAGCSVPREADLATPATTPAPTPTATASPTASAPPSPPPSPSASPSAGRSPSPSPSVKPKPPVPRRVPGYSLTDPPRGLGDPLAAVRGAGDLFATVTVRTVTKDTTPVGLLFLFGVRPQDVGDPRISGLVLPKVVAGVTGGGIPVRTRRLGATKVAVGSKAGAGTIALWYDRGVLAVVVGGGDAEPVTTYVGAYVSR